MNCNPAGIKLITDFESCKLRAYKDVAGIWTIGIGAIGEGIGPGVVWTLQQAMDRFKSDLAVFEDGVTKATQGCTLTDNQFSAMVVFAYNEGLGALRGSTLLKKVKAGQYLDAANEFLKWNRAKVDGELVVVPGLTRRRLAERALFLQA